MVRGSYEKLDYREEDNAGHVTLNGPGRLNVLSSKMINELTSLFQEISEERNVRCVVIGAAGKAFSAGHDFNEIYEGDPTEIKDLFRRCYGMMKKLRELPQPTVASVHGSAAAAGCQLVAACDLAVAEEGTLFSVPGIKMDLFCSTPEVFVSRAIGRKRAFEMGITGEQIDAEQALNWNLINRVAPKGKLKETTDELVQKIARHKLYALETGKRMSYEQISMNDFQALDYATELISLNSAETETKREIKRFLEGEKEL